MQNSQNILLPCPFCAQDAAHFYERTEMRKSWIGVRCGRCGNQTDVFDLTYDGRARAVEYWNRRPSMSMEPVAWGLVFNENYGVNAETTFKRLDQAEEYARKCSAPMPRLMPLYASPVPVPVTITPTHRHKKRGTEYVLIGIGKMQAERWYEPDGPYRVVAGNVDMREVAIYRSVDDGSLWVRPREEFEDERFETLTAALSVKPGEQ